MTPRRRRISRGNKKPPPLSLIERLRSRAERLAEIVFSFLSASVAGLFALLSIWALEQGVTRLGLAHGIAARVIEWLKTLGTIAVFVVYLLSEIWEILRRGFHDED